MTDFKFMVLICCHLLSSVFCQPNSDFSSLWDSSLRTPKLKAKNQHLPNHLVSLPRLASLVCIGFFIGNQHFQMLIQADCHAQQDLDGADKLNEVHQDQEFLWLDSFYNEVPGVQEISGFASFDSVHSSKLSPPLGLKTTYCAYFPWCLWQGSIDMVWESPVFKFCYDHVQE